MLAWEPYVEAKALRARGWSISAIARHLEINRRTVKRYVDGQTEPGVRRRAAAAPDRFEPFVEYTRLRLGEDPHLRATTLHDELVELGYEGSYPALTRALRARRLRPHCEPCQAVRGRDRSIIEHPAGEETQIDWLELPDPPASWGWGAEAHLLVGSLAHSSRWRGVLAPSEDQPHLIEGRPGGRARLHKTANVLAALPKSAHPGAKKHLAEIWNAEDKTKDQGSGSEANRSRLAWRRASTAGALQAEPGRAQQPTTLARHHRELGSGRGAPRRARPAPARTTP
jgi:hypothetical protein